MGAICYGGQTPQLIPAHSGRLQVLRMLNDVMRQPRLKHTPMTNLTELIENAAASIKRRSLIFIVSDFISKPGWERPLRLLTQRHEVLAVRLWDPRETELPDIGPVVMEDAETGEQLYVNTSDRRFRKRFNDASQKRQQAVQTSLRSAGVDLLSLSTEEDMVRALAGFATRRKQFGRQVIR